MHESAEDSELAGKDASQSSLEAIERISTRSVGLVIGISCLEIGDLADSFSRMVTAVKFFQLEAAEASQASAAEAGGGTMSAVSNKVLAPSKPYFGPATGSLLARQCKSHLHIEVSDLAQSHLRDLAKWVENSGVLKMDAAKAAEIAKKIAAL